jgi:hypothetical protein
LLSVRSDDSIIYSTTSPLHRFYYIHFPSVSNYDSNPAVSVRFNDSTTLPLHSCCAFLQVHFPSDRADDSVILRINTYVAIAL